MHRQQGQPTAAHISPQQGVGCDRVLYNDDSGANAPSSQARQNLKEVALTCDTWPERDQYGPGGAGYGTRAPRDCWVSAWLVASEVIWGQLLDAVTLVRRC